MKKFIILLCFVLGCGLGVKAQTVYRISNNGGCVWVKNMSTGVGSCGKLEFSDKITYIELRFGSQVVSADISELKDGNGGSLGATNQAVVTALGVISQTSGGSGTSTVSGTVIANAGTGFQTNALTDVQIRATPLPVSGTVTANTGLNPLTDVQIRATPLPVSGTVTANIGTTNGLALDATLTNGNQKGIVRGGAKGTTTAADVTSTASGANKQPLDVLLYDTAGNPLTSLGGGTQLFRATAIGTGYVANDLLEFNGSAWRNITNPNAITTLASPPTTGTIIPLQGGTVNAQVTKIDASGTTSATANTATTFLAANLNRNGFYIFNKSSAIIYINEYGNTATGGLSDTPILPNTPYEPRGIITTAISIICPTQANAQYYANFYNTPVTGGSTLFIQGATKGGQQTAANSYEVIPASNYTESVQKEWRAKAVTGTPATAIGDIVLQTIKNNGGTVSVTWFNLTTSTIFTVAPTVANLSDVNTGQVLPSTMNGRQNFWMGYEIQTGSGTAGALSSAFITTVGNTRTTNVATYIVPAGKRLRILHWDIEIAGNSSLAANSREWCVYTLRADQTGAAITASTPILATTMLEHSNNTATSQVAFSASSNSNKSFTEGVIDLPAGSTLSVWVNATGNSIMQIQSINGYLYDAQ